MTLSGTSGAFNNTLTSTSSQVETETGEAPGASYAFVWDTSATSTDTASTDPASLKTTAVHTQTYGGSLHAEGDDGPSAWYTLDVNTASSAGSTRIDDPYSVRFTASGSSSESSTAIETNAHNASLVDPRRRRK